MPTAKGKGGPASQQCRTASGYGDAILAQKREYWRTKKREQRARLSERKGKTLQRLNASSGLSCALAAPSFQNIDGSRSKAEDSLLEVSECEKEKWFQTMELNKVLPHLGATCSVAARAASKTAVANCLKPRGAVNRAITSPTFSGPQSDTSSSVPPLKVTRYNNGSSAPRLPPCVSMQGPSVPKMQHKSQVAQGVRPKLLPTDRIFMSSSRGPVSITTEYKSPNATPQNRWKSASQGAQPTVESEEDRAAKRREHWRIKKREQRAKLAAQLVKARERMQSVETAKHAGDGACSAQTFIRGAGRKQCVARVKTLFTSAKREGVKPKSRKAGVAAANPIKAQSLHGNGSAPAAQVCDVASVRKTGESQRKFPNCFHLNVSRGLAHCKTPRQRLMESKSLIHQRNVRCKSPGFESRNIPRIDPGDTPEQAIAKRREYWRVKKREQRAKLSTDVRARLKEKDSLMRRVKRYQKILEEMRKARALATPGSTLTLSHASETIGGFIKEDGTLSANIPLDPALQKKSKEENHKGCKNTVIAQHQPLGLAPVNEPARQRARHESTTAHNSRSLATQTVGQLTLTQPKNPIPGGRATESNVGGCVMKMAVRTTAPPSVPPSDHGLSEEERMANKREYWRRKKREQRAACAARLKQGVLQRRKVQNHLVSVSIELPGRTGSSKPPSSSESPMPLKSDIKQESESVPAVDFNSQAEQTTCPDIKPPASPPAPSVPPPELDMTLNADSQATTLLAVASMKKLLEESLSTVADAEGEQINVKSEASEQDAEPKLPPLSFEKDEAAPLADLMLQIKNWPPDTGSLSPQLRDSNEVIPRPACERSSQAASNFILKPSCGATGGPSSPRRAQRLQAKKASHQNQNSSPPEPPKLHHLPLDQEQYRSSSSMYCHAMKEPSSMTSLQRKREYWKLMKRQQRAKLKARQKVCVAGECTSRQSNVPGLIVRSPPAKQALQPRHSATSATSAPSIPTGQVTNGVSYSLRREQSHGNTGSSQILPDCLGASRGQHQGAPSQQQISKSTDVDSGPLLPTLKPPDNPLSSINLQPIEPPDRSPHSSLRPVKIQFARFQNPTHVMEAPTKLAHMCATVPPKLVPGESEEDFLKRKREYWRIKKKEQRARKAIRDKGIMPRSSSENWRTVPPTQGLGTQDSHKWGSSTEESEHLLSTSLDTSPGSFPCSNYTAPIEDESELLFPDDEDGVITDHVWRNRYLMDHDPLNQLLVCMVCGDLQYSHSLEGVRAHIDEAHPDTLSLDPRERQRILEAWDEQVSQRERFFISQLQQHSGSLAEAQRK